MLAASSFYCRDSHGHGTKLEISAAFVEDPRKRRAWNVPPQTRLCSAPVIDHHGGASIYSAVHERLRAPPACCCVMHAVDQPQLSLLLLLSSLSLHGHWHATRR